GPLSAASAPTRPDPAPLARPVRPPRRPAQSLSARLWPVGLIAMYRVCVDQQTRQEIAAAGAAHRELGPNYDDAVAEGLVERIGAEIDRRGGARPGAHRRGLAPRGGGPREGGPRRPGGPPGPGTRPAVGVARRARSGG